MRKTFDPACAVLLVLATALHVSAEIIIDPQPRLRWEQMVECEVVVVAKYKSHQDKTLTVEVVRVLKGQGIKVGAALAIGLEHWYSVERGPFGFARWVAKTKDGQKGPPNLCYKQQIMNPGPAVPMPILKDVREPALYFLPKAKAPALSRRGQVHEAHLAEGWDRVVHGQPPDLFFRLTQTVDAGRQREALEELYEQRDPATLDRLFDWLHRLPDEMRWRCGAFPILQAIGDRRGDVYDRALRQLTKDPGKNQYQPFALLRLLAASDPGRAFADFRRFMKDGPTSLRQAAWNAFGYIRTDSALNYFLELLDNPQRRNGALYGLQILFQGEGSAKVPAAVMARFKERAAPHLKKLLASDKLDEQQRRNQRAIFYNVIGAPPQIDLDRAEKVLLDPAEKCYHGWADGPGARLLKEIEETAEPRFIPLLVRILVEVPTARKENSSSFAALLQRYAALYPNALNRALAKHDKLFPVADFYGYKDPRDNLCQQLGRPRAVNHFRSGRLARGQPVPWTLVLELKKYAAYTLTTDCRGCCGHLARLLGFDLAEGVPLLEQALAFSDHNQSTCRQEIVALAARYGYPERGPLAPQLGLVDFRRYPEALAKHLKEVDGARQLTTSYFVDLDYKYQAMLYALHPAHPDALEERLLSLLASTVSQERRFAQEVIVRTLGSSLGYRPDDFARHRAESLDALRPKLKARLRMTTAQRRVTWLREQGVDLTSAGLQQAALSHNQEVAEPALGALGDLVGLENLVQLARLPPWQRQRVLAFRLQDHRDARPATRLTPDEWQSLWAELAAEGQAGYLALVRLRCVEKKQAVELIRQHLRPAAALEATRGAKLLDDLDSDVFKIRHQSTLELARHGDSAVVFLRHALRQKLVKSLEMERRIEKLLVRLDRWTPERLRAIRLLDLLEHSPTADGQQALQELADGLPDAWLTRHARAALDRCWFRSM